MRLRCVTIERCGVIERHAHLGLFALRADEGVDKGTQPFKRRSLVVFEYGAQQATCLAPFIALQPEQKRGLVGEILIERPYADAGLFRHPGGGETLCAFARQNLNSRLQNRLNKVRGASLFWLLS